MALNGYEFGKPFLLRQRVRLRDLPGKTVRNADVSRLARLHDAIQSVHNVFKRCLPVPHVIDVEIHVVHAEVLKTCVDHVLDVLLPADSVLDLFLCSRKEFGGNDNVFTLCEVAQCLADILFAGSALIGDGCVVEINTQFQSALYDLS